MITGGVDTGGGGAGVTGGGIGASGFMADIKV